MPGTPGTSTSNDVWQLGEGAAYSQNREGGTQQIVIIDKDWGNANSRRHGASQSPPHDADAEDGRLEGTTRTRGSRGGDGNPPSVDWMLRGLAIAGVIILVIVLLAVFNSRRGGNDAAYEYDGGYVA